MHRVTVRMMAPALLVCSLLWVGGCRKAAPTPVAGAGVPGSPVAATGGRAVFETNCTRCHAIGGPAATPSPGPGMGPKRGPDLAKVAVDPKHSREWLLAYIRDPKAQNPKSGMPKFAGIIPDADLDALADYLLTLK